MKKYFLTIIIFFGLYSTVIARHITGGELYYTYIGPGASANSFKYQITLRLYRDCYSTGAQLDDVAAISTNDVWAVGDYLPNVGGVRTLVEHWDGMHWGIVPSPNVGSDNNLFLDVVAISSNDVWAVGYYY